MTDVDLLADRFEENRPHLRAVAYRMLGSLAEADDAVQEAWLRLSRVDSDAVDNLGGWLTTVVGRVCLDMLRSRQRRGEEPLDPADEVTVGEAATGTPPADPEQEALLADSVGVALLVVLDTLTPVERLTFVLHDLFAMPFEEIAPIVGRGPAATRQLASRARRRVRAGGDTGGVDADPGADAGRGREIVDAFLAAARAGEFAALLTLLDPDVVVRADAAAIRMGGSARLQGSAAVAAFFSGSAQGASTALLDGVPGAVVHIGGVVRIALHLTIAGGRITGIDAIADPRRLRELDVAILDAR